MAKAQVGASKYAGHQQFMHPNALFVGRQMAAEILSVSTRTIDDAIKAGDLQAFRIGRRVVIQESALMGFAMRLPTTA